MMPLLDPTTLGLLIAAAISGIVTIYCWRKK